MKPSLLSFFSAILLFFTSWQGDLNANPDCTSGNVSFETSFCADDLMAATETSSCYGPSWHNTYGITQYSATFEWEHVYDASYYTFQWRYPGGSWYNLSGYCYSNWVTVNNFQSCHAYEWRVRSHCGYGYYSSWCYPVNFNTLCDNCPEPHSTYTSNITDHSADLHWSSVYGADSYTVQIQWPGGGWTTVSGSPCQPNWLSVHNLQPGTSYDWRVRANCDYYNTSDWAYGWFATTHSNYCHSPSWQQCYNITDHSATWKWEPVYGADYYHVQWRYPGGSWYDLGDGYCYGSWLNVYNLNPCTSYEWRVKSYCHYGGWSNWCSPYHFTTTCHNTCAVPTGMHTIDIGDYKATFKWSPVYGATSYNVQIKDAWGNWYDVPGSPTSGIWITVSNLSSCKTYEWRVRANCGYHSHGAWSKSLAFSTSCGHGCHAPEWAYTNGISNSSAILHWGPVSGADHYVVELRTGNGAWSEIPGGPVSNTFVELTGLQANTTYEWRVKSHCHTGFYSGWSSIAHFTTSGLSCGMPMFRYTLPITDSTATFNWTAVAGALNYTVQVRPIGGQWEDVDGSPTTGTSITATGLSPNTMYEWRMQVNCSNGAYSLWLSPVMFVTGAGLPCKTPLALYADSVTLNSGTLHWSAVPGAESYSVEIRELPHGNWHPVDGSPVDTNYIDLDSLNGFTTYEWRVRTNCGNGQFSFWSGVVQFTTTDAPPCNAPDSLHSSLITETTATFHWLPVAGALGYKVQTRLPGGSWINIPGWWVSDTTVLVSGFTPNTTYEWRVSTQCDSVHISNWSPAATFTTIGSVSGNDDCSNAVVLNVETTCVPTFASNVDASASTPAPSGGCPSNGHKDVWFKFTMPNVNNPAVTIRTGSGSLGNAVMEVYSGTECGILSLVACEDNNDNGNGSSMPVINLTGTPNTTIWVRVWGIDGATGTFTICVFDFISFNYTAIPDAELPTEDLAVDLIEEEVPVTMTFDTKADLHVSPNPVSDELQVVVQQTELSRVVGLRIIDLSGKPILTQVFENATGDQFKSDVDVSNLLPGIYLLQVQTTNGIMAEKISVIR